jgi:hypothetical protein
MSLTVDLKILDKKLTIFDPFKLGFKNETKCGNRKFNMLLIALQVQFNKLIKRPHIHRIVTIADMLLLYRDSFEIYKLKTMVVAIGKWALLGGGR